MATIKIRGHTFDVDVEAELRQFEWIRPDWKGNKLIAASPFRFDKTPSFFVNLDGHYAGTWADSGAYDAEWASGNFVKLLAFLRNETYEESEEYLLGVYGFNVNETDTITLKRPTLKFATQRKYLATELLSKYNDDYSYLFGRGISADIQRQASVKYDAASRAIVIPWFDANGRLCNVKYRTTYGKTFWYERGAVPVRDLVYGIETITGPKAVLCEAEIDALSWRQMGAQAIAVGGANFTDKQADVIKRSPISTLFLSGDNDKAGRKFNEQVADKLRGHVDLRIIEWTEGVKDANDALRSRSENVETFRVNTNGCCGIMKKWLR